jgi:serine-type D-Ala-D-Ala carboxypeptidase/endopeptidase
VQATIATVNRVLVVLGLGLVGLACGGSSRSAAPGGAATEADPRGAHEAAIAAQVQPMIDGEIASGIVIGIYDAGKLEIYGFGSGPGGKRPDGRTLFELGSVTKVYTSLLLADAVQRREVELDTPVAALLPPGVTAPTAGKDAITLRHLALHSSGLPRLPPSLEPRAQSTNPYAGYGENELYADLVRTRLDAPPGTRIAYSNYGVGLLGHVLGAKLGVGYREAVKTRILTPLGLSDTFFTVPPQAAARKAQGTSSELVRVPAWHWDALSGAGALISTARDQLVLVEAELEAAAGGRATLRRAMALTQESQLEDSGANAGLGWQIDGEGRYWHNGTTGGHHAFVGFDPKTRRGIVLLASTAAGMLDQITSRIYKILAGEQVKPIVMPTAEQLASYAGTYQFGDQPLTMVVEGRRIYVEGPGEPKIRMLPIGEREFWIEPLQAIVVFEPEDGGGGGKAKRAVFVIGERQLTLPRVD